MIGIMADTVRITPRYDGSIFNVTLGIQKIYVVAGTNN
jgi:hypothetical protein